MWRSNSRSTTISIAIGGDRGMTGIARRRFLGAGIAGIAVGVPARGKELESPRTRENRERIDLADFGYSGDWDGTRGRDDTEAWRRAIAAAAARGAGTIAVPRGATGASFVAGAIVDGPLPSGLVFEAEQPVLSSGASGVTIVYGGTGTCWNVDHRGRGGSEGRWTFRGLGFRTLDPRATMFDFNRATTHGTVRDADPQSYSTLENIRFEGCYFQGAGGGARQTGDAIRGAKLFQLVVDETSFVRDFRRGVWLHGCDNCTIAVRSFLCARSVMVEASGTFGNDNRIDSRFLGGSPAASSEDVYFVWDNANSTAIHESYLEELDHRRAVALVYLDGYETLLLRPHMAGRPAFRLGPNAREIVMIAPAITRYETVHQPVIDAPASWDFGYEQSDHRMTVVAASRNVQLTFGVHPRLLWSGAVPTANHAVRPVPQAIGVAGLAAATGYGPASRTLTPLNWWARAAGTSATGGIAGMVRDASASTGWAIHLSPATPQGGLAAQLVVGHDVFAHERVRLRMRVRSANPAGWFSVVTRSGHGFAQAVPIAEDASRENTGGKRDSDWRLVEHIVDLAGWQTGDTFEHVIYQGERPRTDLLIDFIDYARLTG